MSPITSPPELLKGRKLLIFDFDGTLADTSPLHARAFSSTLRPEGLTVDYTEIAGLKTADAFSRIFARAGRTLTEERSVQLVAAKQQAVRALIREELRAIPGASSFLSWARSRYRLALCTSGSRGTVQLSLEVLGWSALFDPFVCAEDVSRGKPAPDAVELVLARAQARPEEALLFEDSASGVRGGLSAGVGVVSVTAEGLEGGKEVAYVPWETWESFIQAVR